MRLDDNMERWFVWHVLEKGIDLRTDTCEHPRALRNCSGGGDTHDTKPKSNIKDLQAIPEVRVVCTQPTDSFLHLTLNH